MRIKNEMERTVQAEIGRLTRKDTGAPGGIGGSLSRRVKSWLSGAKKRTPCYCAVCSADTAALALTQLPSRYCRTHHYGINVAKVDPGEVSTRVNYALRRVTLRPRHPVGQPYHQRSGILLVDLGLKEGLKMVGALLKRIEGACACPICREDTLALGLNAVPPRYGVQVKGRYRFPPHHLEFTRDELLPILSRSAGKIARNPRHGEKDPA